MLVFLRQKLGDFDNISKSYLVEIFLIAAMPQFYIHLVYSIGQLRAVSNEKNEYVFLSDF